MSGGEVGWGVRGSKTEKTRRKPSLGTKEQPHDKLDPLITPFLAFKPVLNHINWWKTSPSLGAHPLLPFRASGSERCTSVKVNIESVNLAFDRK